MTLVDGVLAASGAALGVRLTDAEELSRGRSLVLRARAGDRTDPQGAAGVGSGAGPGAGRAADAARTARGAAAPRVLDGTDPVQNAAGPTRRAFVQHRLDTVPGSGPLADLAAETAAALRLGYGDRPLDLAPAFR